MFSVLNVAMHAIWGVPRWCVLDDTIEYESLNDMPQTINPKQYAINDTCHIMFNMINAPN